MYKLYSIGHMIEHWGIPYFKDPSVDFKFSL